MTDFEINESVLDKSSVDIIDQKMQKAVERISIERQKLLALALHKGYDGVDIFMGESIVTDYRDYSMGFRYEAWQEEAATIDRFERNVQRYDFRVLDEEEKQRLLARIGVVE